MHTCLGNEKNFHSIAEQTIYRVIVTDKKYDRSGLKCQPKQGDLSSGNFRADLILLKSWGGEIEQALHKQNGGVDRECACV